MPRHVTGRLRVVAQVEHDQRIAQSGKAQADAAFVARFFLLLRQGPDGDVQHVVQHAGRHARNLGERGLIEARVVIKWIEYKPGQVNRAEAAAAVGRQGLFGAVMHIQAVGIEGVNVLNGDVVNLFFAIGCQGLHGDGEPLAVVFAPVGLPQLFKAQCLGCVAEADQLGISVEIVTADDKFMCGLGLVVGVASSAIGQGPGACMMAVLVDFRGDPEPQQHALRGLQQGQISLCESHAHALVLGTLYRTIGIKQSAQQADMERRGRLLDGRGHGFVPRRQPQTEGQIPQGCRSHPYLAAPFNRALPAAKVGPVVKRVNSGLRCGHDALGTVNARAE